MSNTSIGKRLGSVCLCMVLAAGLISRTLPATAASIPAKVAVQSGVTVLKNEKAVVDASNLAEGFVTVKYTGGKNVRIKVQIIWEKTPKDPYNYDLNNAGNAETFPLTQGDGTYTIKVLENTSGTKYAQAYSTTVKLTARDQYLPYLYPNQYVNYSDSSKVVTKAAELVKGKSATLDKVAEIYHFVVNNFTYDYDLADKVAKKQVTGYLPDVDKVLSAKKGICFDYAAVMAAMLRSQGIPCKLVVGYAGEIYHAWINVYVDGSGWIDKVIAFDGKSWTLMDPTFVSSGNSSADIMKYVTNGKNYTQKYAY